MRTISKLSLLTCFISLVLTTNCVSAKLEPVKKAPMFSMTRADGKKETLNTLVGTGMERSVLVLSFFDTKCEPCLRELPHLISLYKKYQNTKDVKIRLVSLDAGGNKVIDPYIKKHGIIIPVLLDREGLYAGEKYGVVKFGRAKVPKLFIISKNKIIKNVFSGFKEGEEDKFESTLAGIIDKLTKEKVIKEFSNKLTILYTNSANGYLESCDCPENPFGGLVRRATAIKDIRGKTEAVLLVDSGDSLSPYPNKTLAGYVFRILAFMDYDAIGIGDQEFINSALWLNNVIEKQPYGNLPFLCTNAQLCDDKLCWNLTRKYLVKEVGKYRVGIISALSPDIFFFYPPDKKPKGLKILNSTGTIKTYVDILRNDKKVDVVVLLSHSGTDKDKLIAKQVSGIDVIIGGHSQTLLETPVVINDTLIVQAGENGQRLGKLTLNFDNYGKRGSYNNDLIILTRNVPDDPVIRKLINAYNEELKKQAGKLLSK